MRVYMFLRIQDLSLTYSRKLQHSQSPKGDYSKYFTNYSFCIKEIPSHIIVIKFLAVEERVNMYI